MLSASCPLRPVDVSVPVGGGRVMNIYTELKLKRELDKKVEGGYFE